jgi:autotransporter-associated beta strand protein
MKKVLLSTITLIALTFLNFSSFAQLYWGGAGGAFNSPGWSTSNAAPYTTVWTNNSNVVFNLDGTVAAPTASSNFLSLTCNANVSLTSFTSTIGTNGTIANINIASGKTFDFGTQGFTTSVSTGFVKDGDGTLALSGNTYGAGFTLNAGTVVARGVNAFGQSATNTLNINGGTIAADGTTTFLSTKFASIVVGADFILGSITAPASSIANLSFASPANLGASNRIIILNGTGTNTFSGIISGSGGIETGTGSTGTLVLSGANTYSGGTTISGGTLTLGASEVIPNTSLISFKGGTLKTGATAGFSETFSTVSLLENTKLALGTGTHTLNFAASNSISWTTAKTLTITGWVGTNNGAGTSGKIFFGNNISGITSTQLSQIKFFNGTVNSDASILATGEVVPTGTLPIQLTAFTGKAINQSILLNWNTASETNNDFYDVLRSADGKSFTSIGTVKGSGTSTTSKDYAFSDENPFAGTNYYQLVQHDFDGKNASSTIISIDSKIDATKLRVYANVSSVKVSISSPNKTKGLLHVFDITGRKLSETSIEVNKGFNHFDLPLSLVNGVHFARFTSDNETINQKFIK